jgi:hypothetical protein
MASHNTFQVNDTPVRITPPGVHSGMDITIQNTSLDNNVFLGGPGTLNSSTFGYMMPPLSTFSVELPPRDAIYAVTENGDALVAVFRLGLE